jgi:hypothetical protein
MPFQFAPVAEDSQKASAAKVLVTYHGINFTAATTEAMVTLTPVRDGVNGSTGTSFVVTSNKRFVLLALTVLTKNAGAAGQGVITRLRYNPAGATIVSSPILAVAGAGTSLAIANIVGVGFATLSQGWPTHYEIAGDGTKTIGISQIGTATAGNDVTLVGYEY